MMPIVDLVVVNWNSGDGVSRVLTSLSKHHGGVVKSLIIVDNASTDGSVEAAVRLGVSLPFDVVILRNDTNRGFGAACNQGARMCRGELILFLNPDTEVFERSLPGSVSFLKESRHMDVAVVGIRLVDSGGRVSRTCARSPTAASMLAQSIGLSRLSVFAGLRVHMTEWDHASTTEVDHVIGAFYLIRRQIFEDIGGFDERFFVYLEDLDLSVRVRKIGHKIMFLADVDAYHEGGGTSKKVKSRRLCYSLSSRLLYAFKHFRRWEAWCLVAATLIIEPISRTIWCLWSRQGMLDTWRGFGMLYREVPSVLARVRLP